MQDMNGLLEQLRKMFGQQGGQVTNKPAFNLDTTALQDALAQTGARPMIPPDMTKKPIPLNPESVAGVASDFVKQNLPSQGDPGAFMKTLQDKAMEDQSAGPRIPKAGGGRNLQRVSPGVYRNQKGGLVQRKTGGR